MVIDKTCLSPGVWLNFSDFFKKKIFASKLPKTYSIYSGE